MTKSKTQQALDLMQKNPGMTAYEAASKVGVGNAAVYQALRRTKGKTLCPCCGQVVREGFEVDPGRVNGSAD
jgi:predicted transcriptional regulator